MSRFVFTTALTIALLFSPVLFADTAVVSVDAAPETAGARALQALTLQALADQGLDTADPEALRSPESDEAAREAAREAGATRLFVLHLAPLSEAVLASLEEVTLDQGHTVARASLMIQRPEDSARALGRLATSVVSRAPIEESQLVSTVTQSESQPYSKRPGEFMVGMSLWGGVGAADVATVPALYGTSLRLFYETPDFTFGGTLGGAGSENGGLFEMTIRGHYLFSQSDVSGYLGGGLGISFMTMTDRDLNYGAHAVLSGGVEAFRLHATRLVVGADLLFPTYTLDRRAERYDEQLGRTIDVSTETYVVVPTLTVAVMF